MSTSSRASIGLTFRDFEQELPLFRQFLEFVPDAVVAVNTRREIVFANSSTEEIFGYTRSELIGRPLADLLPERFRDRHAGHEAHYFAAPRIRPMGTHVDLFGLRADGSEFPAEISLSLIQAGDEILALSVIRDISGRVGAEQERMRLEAELKLNQSRRLESIGKLAGGVAHDFNNLLAVIINYSEFVSTAVGDDPETLDDVGQITLAARRAADLTRQLLTFSRRELTRPRPLNINTTLANIEKLLRRTLGEDIDLTTNFESDIWTVTADPGQLEQIVMNLTVNARDAMKNGGALAIETRNVEIEVGSANASPDSPEPGRYVQLTVADNGPGMPPEVVEHAFEPFFTTKEAGEGTGLGLATVYGIVKAAAGKISIDSAADRGTTIKILLPVHDVDPEVESAREHQKLLGSGELVMVVEDEDSVRTLVERVLTGNGYQVISFSRAREALESIENEPTRVDLLLTDVVMPEMQGSALASEARNLRPGLRVSFMSGYSEMLVSRMDATEAARDLIEKPFTSAELLAHVREVLDREGV